MSARGTLVRGSVAARRARLAVIVALALVTVACASGRPAPVVDRSTPVRPAPQASAPQAKPAAPIPAPVPTPAPAPEPSVQVGQVARPDAIEARPLDAPVALPAPAAGAPAAPVAPPPTAGTTPAPLPRGVVTEPRAFKLPFSEENLALIQRGETAPRADAAKPPADAPKPGASAAPAPAAKPEAPAAQDAAKPAAPAPAAPPVASAPANANEPDRVEWSWPATGRVIEKFAGQSKGVSIAGEVGQAVNAAADGRVLYVGSALRGYGNLVIVKHNETFLSAYAHNSRILVKVGQNVTRGQKIAELGQSDSDRPKLHFEIRRAGKPVDPLAYLPGMP